jgi:hypothetical protein
MGQLGVLYKVYYAEVERLFLLCVFKLSKTQAMYNKVYYVDDF